MKFWTVTMLACGVALTAVIAANSFAQAPGGGMGGGMGGQGGNPRARAAAAMFDRFDINGDGKITREEFDEANAQRFEQLDVNKDGSITFEELTAQSKGQNAQRMRALFDHADKNGDGRLDKDEFAAISDMQFERIDINGDGVITREEFDEFIAQRQGQGQRGQGQGMRGQGLQ